MLDIRGPAAGLAVCSERGCHALQEGSLTGREAPRTADWLLAKQTPLYAADRPIQRAQPTHSAQSLHSLRQ